ncbi:ANTAR domain-containing response regulator [Sedimenticola thiotaurini]|uniref:Response regulator n=1 Tax=Sedimenticola thiotaurini TaxID=1543721 RepID=A0A0F7K1B0_9GAMM|nr:response regulator [Sedimenticola thiotaurini]AKH21344.1 hypothetical protein AAY24_14330 [Sedimenticola thiotaurini]
MKKNKILVADDDMITLTSITSGLSDAGYLVVSAQDGRSAVQLGLREKPDLALLDIRMPGISGIEAARELKAEGGISTLFLSAYSDHDMVESATREGALGYLVKPVNTQQLIPAIEAALKRARDLQQLRQKESDLLGAIHRNREISVAVGIYMQRFDADEQSAFEAIRRYARSRSLKLATLSSQLVNEIDIRDDLFREIYQYDLQHR